MNNHSKQKQKKLPWEETDGQVLRRLFGEMKSRRVATKSQKLAQSHHLTAQRQDYSISPTMAPRLREALERAKSQQS
ncbi:hypothetical protein QS26_11930 [Salmonella enterica subsp. enterica serovar Havana]|uniref:Uncharacterized protein n=1 Tax=Salmonella enterica subsp. enterica serovar Havana TaxID=179997 RepID=A0A3V3U5T0_SALET|nr:hypothetical protein [Salmonella enterica subsp. enterica serovar Havana]EBK9970269.1 hypothetical protein [Salmonella enterica]EBH8291322.1 hypothetical protein [Salmonella enterica subsp. enterica serovar Havana]EBS2531462.1 hypothetical protein [Salmonella enterica subsp. enterica serovar Havana]EBV2394242.1 hypothetical protein [Salmonella enterica subsp. enterica serovar Havana]